MHGDWGNCMVAVLVENKHPSGCASLELYEGDPQVCFSWDVHKIRNYLLHLLACESMRVFITCRSRIGGASF